ncbi:MAG: hypothetical protein ACRCX2_27470 [Paraclostridium sp.]
MSNRKEKKKQRKKYFAEVEPIVRKLQRSLPIYEVEYDNYIEGFPEMHPFFEFKVKGLSQWRFAYYFGNFIGEYIPFIDKFKPTRTYISCELIEEFIKKVREVVIDEKCHIVLSYNYGSHPEDDIDTAYEKIMATLQEERMLRLRDAKKLRGFLNEGFFDLVPDVNRIVIHDEGPNVSPRYDILICKEEGIDHERLKEIYFTVSDYMENELDMMSETACVNIWYSTTEKEAMRYPRASLIEKRQGKMINQIKNQLLGYAEMQYIDDVLYLNHRTATFRVAAVDGGIVYGYSELPEGFTTDNCPGSVHKIVNIFREVTGQVEGRKK